MALDCYNKSMSMFVCELWYTDDTVPMLDSHGIMDGPFNVTGNGYFASWAGVAAALSANFAAKEVVFDS